MNIRLSRTKIILILILLLAATFRLYNINWDQGHHMHPDERAIVMAVDELKFPTNISHFLSPQSTWNPDFFAYGSFPMYLLRAAGNAAAVFNSELGQYTSINLVGRFISALADLFTVFLIFLIGRKLFNSSVGLLAAFFYAISVLPIQLSHFYAVDTLLTCFILATLYSLLKFYEKPDIKRSVTVGLFFGLSLATKVSAIVLIASIGTALVVDFALIFIKNPHKPKHWLPHLPKFIKRLAGFAAIIFSATVLTFIFFEPYALLDFKNFWAQTLQQSELTKNPFYFPYTLQYVGKIPYVYEFKNVFFWGLGPVISLLSFAGIAYYIFHLKKARGAQFAKAIIILMFFIIYILVVGKFSVGFMRYMLPVYPFFALFAAVLVYKIISSIKSQNLRVLTSYFLLLTSIVWPLSFIQIYKSPNTRVQASEWIYSNIPPGKILAVEHWDDQLPIGKPVNYPSTTLKLYDPDSDVKWREIEQQLAISDYIIIASNRLYTPLQKLTDCRNLPSFRCYPETASYYRKLFSGEMGFKKVAEFSNFPAIPFLNIPIDDQDADENFTVFDHPKIMIFQKIPKI